MRALALALGVVTWSGLAAAPAQACTCSSHTMAERYPGADHALHVRIAAAEVRGDERVYRAALVEDDFAGCLRAGSEVVLSTPAGRESCGVLLSVGDEALVYALRAELEAPASSGAPQLEFNLCSGSLAWSEVDAQLRDFLATRPRRCDGGQRCEGQPVVQCFVDPCQVSQCEAAGAACQASYCGGCHARWFANGVQVCGPAPVCRYDDPARRYFARSPEACQAVRFACQPEEEMFFDPCGCGCARR